MYRNGQYLETPIPPSKNGYEAAGIIEAVGPGVDSAWIGKTVSTVPGTFKLNKHGVYGEGRNCSPARNRRISLNSLV